MTTTDIHSAALDYVELTQPVLRKFAEQTASYQTKAAEVASAFVACNLISERNRSAFQTKLAEDPLVALDYLIKLATIHATPAQELGDVVDTAKTASAPDDVFMQTYRSGGMGKS